jgi:hypothetical protein
MFGYVYVLNYSHLVMIARLNMVLRAINSYNNFSSFNSTPYKADLVYIIDIIVLNAVLIHYILKKLKMLANYLRIFLFCLLVIILLTLCKLHF